MKKSVYLLLAALAISMACTTPEGTITEDPTLSVDPKSLVIESAGGSKSVTVTANNAWEAAITSGNDWITIEKSANSLTVSTPASPLHQSRMGSVTVTSGALSETISVTQLGTPNNDKIEVTPTTLSYDNAGGDKTVTVTANVTVSAVSSESWLTVKAPASASSPMTYTLTAAANTGSETRNATVTFSGGDAEAVTVQVTQTPASFITADKNEINAEAAGGEFDVVITSNVEWTAASSENWVNLTPALGTNTTIKITVAANEATAERSATVTLSKDNISAVIAVKQAASATPAAPTPAGLLATWRCDDAEYTDTHSPDWSTADANATSHGTGKGIALPEDGAPAGTQMTWVFASGHSYGITYITAAEGHYAVKAVGAGDGYLFTIPGQNLKKDQIVELDCAVACVAQAPKNWVIKFRLNESSDWVIGESSTTTTTKSGATAHMVISSAKDFSVNARFQATYTVPEDTPIATIQAFICAADAETVSKAMTSGATSRLIPLAAISGVDEGFPGPRITIK